MAIKKVVTELADNSTELDEITESQYEGDLEAPEESGIYEATVSAYDEAGNVAVATSDSLEVTTWKTPYTYWTANDRFNYVDYNRIKNNLQYLYEKAVQLYKSFDIVDMGDDIDSFGAYWKVDFFNAWEENLEIINNNVLIQDYGEKQTFYENGIFIKYDELNRIEGAILQMKELLDSQEAGLRRLPFRLGTFKEVRI